jgi:hypothetical protein
VNVVLGTIFWNKLSDLKRQISTRLNSRLADQRNIDQLERGNGYSFSVQVALGDGATFEASISEGSQCARGGGPFSCILAHSALFVRNTGRLRLSGGEDRTVTEAELLRLPSAGGTDVVLFPAHYHFVHGVPRLVPAKIDILTAQGKHLLLSFHEGVFRLLDDD